MPSLTNNFLFWLYIDIYFRMFYFAFFLPYFLGYLFLDLSMSLPRKPRIYLHFFIIICYIAAIKILLFYDLGIQGKIGPSSLCLNPLTEKHELCPGSPLLIMQNDPWSIIPTQMLFRKMGLPFLLFHPQTTLLLLLIPYFLGMLSFRSKRRKRRRSRLETRSKDLFSKNKTSIH